MVFLRIKADYFVVSFSQLSFSVEVQIIIQKVIRGEGIRMWHCDNLIPVVNSLSESAQAIWKILFGQTVGYKGLNNETSF